MTLSVIPLILQLLELGIQIVPELISAAKLEISLFTSPTPPSAAEQTQIDQAYAQAQAALQAAKPAA